MENMSDLAASILNSKTIDAIKAKVNAEFLENLPPKVLKRVEFLKGIQSEHDEFEAKFFEERRALEDKYQKLYQPLYNKRYDIVNGIVEVDGISSEQEADKPAEVKGVPDFWLTAMKTNEVLGEAIREQDEHALKFLKDIKCHRLDVSKEDEHKGEATKGFKLEFFFDPNPFFKNSVLTKTYFMIDEDEPILEKAVGTDIEWFHGKSLIEKVLRKKPKKGSKKPVLKTENIDSFFNFFYPPEVPEGDEEIEEDVADELQAMMETDYDVGSTIKEKLIPHAVSWFTGEAAEDDDLGDFDLEGDDEDEDEDDEDSEGDEDEDEDEDDEEDEDDDDDDEDADRTDSQKKKGGAKALGGEAQQEGERPPECKQQ